ncbi:MAG: hypothetical protein HYX76_01745 [Acidobacteria bacterium]|nr:hypothetical protein [Acidobacteriota bacterium]
MKRSTGVMITILAITVFVSPAVPAEEPSSRTGTAQVQLPGGPKLGCLALVEINGPSSIVVHSNSSCRAGEKMAWSVRNHDATPHTLTFDFVIDTKHLDPLKVKPSATPIPGKGSDLLVAQIKDKGDFVSGSPCNAPAGKVCYGKYKYSVTLENKYKLDPELEITPPPE